MTFRWRSSPQARPLLPLQLPRPHRLRPQRLSPLLRRQQHLRLPQPRHRAAGAETIAAPMPGNIMDVKVTAGQSVTKGQVLVILEAMKMENEIMAPRDGVVAGVHVNKGESVDSGKVLISLN